MQPLIGIWWDDGTTLVALSHPRTENASGNTLIDSDFNHVDEWPRIAGQFGVDSGEDYFRIPRGRVIFDAENEISLLYHGGATGRDRLELIAKTFQLDAHVCRRDEHYEQEPPIDEDDM